MRPVSGSQKNSNNEILNSEGGVPEDNYQQKEISFFELFKKFFSDAFSAVFSAISRVFSNPAQRQAAMMHVRNEGDIVIEEKKVEPTLEEQRQKILEDGARNFSEYLDMKRKGTSGNVGFLSENGRKYAEHLRDAFEEKRKTHSAYSLSDEELEKIKYVAEIFGMEDKKLSPVPVAEAVSETVRLPQKEIQKKNNAEKSKVQIEEKRKPDVHHGEPSFLKFFNIWKINREEWEATDMVNQNETMLQSYADEGCKDYARMLIDPDKTAHHRNQPEYTEKLSAAHYLLGQYDRYEKRIANEEKLAERKRERTDRSEVEKEREKTQAQILSSSRFFAERSGSKLGNLYENLKEIPKENIRELFRILNAGRDNKLIYENVINGFKVLMRIESDSVRKNNFLPEEIARLKELHIFSELIQLAFNDKNGNPVKSNGTGVQIYKYEQEKTEKVLDKINENSSEIQSLINQVIGDSRIAKNNVPIVASSENSESLSHSSSMRPAEIPKNNNAAPSPPPLPPLPTAELKEIPAFPEMFGARAEKIYKFIYPDPSVMDAKVFKSEIYNKVHFFFSAVVVDESDMKSKMGLGGENKAGADAFCVQWKRAVRSGRNPDFDEFALIDLYVDKHLQQNQDLMELI